MVAIQPTSNRTALPPKALIEPQKQPSPKPPPQKPGFVDLRA